MKNPGKYTFFIHAIFLPAQSEFQIGNELICIFLYEHTQIR